MKKASILTSSIGLLEGRVLRMHKTYESKKKKGKVGVVSFKGEHCSISVCLRKEEIESKTPYSVIIEREGVKESYTGQTLEGVKKLYKDLRSYEIKKIEGGEKGNEEV